MRIAIIGAGMVGKALGRGWSEGGHEVVYGLRDPSGSRREELSQAVPSASTATVEEALAGAEVVMLAVPPDAIAELGSRGDWNGKVVLDATNRIGAGRPAAEDVSEFLRGARPVKAFNCIGANLMTDPVVAGERASMFICGDDAEAKATASVLAEGFGFEVIDAGPYEASAQLEAMAGLWVRLARQGYGWNIAYRLLRGEPAATR